MKKHFARKREHGRAWMLEERRAGGWNECGACGGSEFVVASGCIWEWCWQDSGACLWCFVVRAFRACRCGFGRRFRAFGLDIVVTRLATFRGEGGEECCALVREHLRASALEERCANGEGHFRAEFLKEQSARVWNTSERSK